MQFPTLAMRRAFWCGLLLVLPFSIAAQDGRAAPLSTLPLAAKVQEKGEVQDLIRAAIQDYEKRLPQEKQLVWVEGASSWRSWSPAVEALAQRCPYGKPDCVDLLEAQQDELAFALNTAGKGTAAELTAAGWSAVAGLCNLATSLSCTVNKRLINAALEWLFAGNDALFAAYLERYQQERSQYLEYHRSRGEKVPPWALAQLPEVPNWVLARHAEVRGNLHTARLFWLGRLSDGVLRKDADWQREGVYQLARLSWRLGEVDAARGWESHLAALPGHAADVAQRGCQERHEQWRVDIARAAARAGPLAAPSRTLEGLIAADCPFSRAVLEYATDTLIATPSPAQLEGVRSLLARAVSACTRCPPLRQQALTTLARLLDPSSQARRAIASAQRAGFARHSGGPGNGGATEEDHRVTWAVGATLLRDPVARADGAAIVLALQEQLQWAADADRSSSSEAQRNRSRHEPLYRLGAVAALAQGTQLDLRQIEAMRAQTLLRRLRLEALAAELAHVGDPAAENLYRERVAAIQPARDKINALSATDPDVAWLRTSSHLMFDEVQEMARLALLEALAARSLDGEDPRKAYLRTLAGGGAIQQMEIKGGSVGRNPLSSLDPDEAYLSWLQVPGGYIAAIATFDADYRPPYVLKHLGGHRRRDLFIPLSVAQEESVRLYRELLLSGGGGNRGARRADAVIEDAGGLRLRGAPVWRTREGTFVAQATAPAGAQRVRHMRELGAQIYAWLLEPLRPQWATAKRLVISPDGLLTLLPFETLVASDKLLIEQLDVSYVQSLEVHAELKRRTAARSAGAHTDALLSVAAPDYASAKASEAAPAWMAVQWQPLPGTEREARALKQLYPEGTLLAGEQASRTQVLDLNGRGELQKYSLLHFATHGYVDDQRSALVLSTRQGLQQAYLTDKDISGLRLQSDLVLLSACDTALGRQQSGEGVVGLPYAFMLAGNVNTLMSLWPVDDDGTAQFVPELMAKARRGMDLVTALNATKRDFAAGTFGERNRDPRIWAAFVQYGVPLRLR